jgi:hypothetical protein
MQGLKSTGWILLGMAVLMTGCMRTQRARQVETSGFLKEDYTLMRKTKGEVAQMLYINSAVDFKKYNKVLIEPVTIWRTPDSKLEQLSAEETQMLGRYLHVALAEKLGQNYQVVATPGEGTLRLRFAIAEASKSVVVLDMITTIVPVGVVIDKARFLGTGTHAFVGKAVAEGEIRDAQSGDLLAAGLAARIGGKRILDPSKLSSWGDVKASFDKVAEDVDRVLGELRAGTLDVEYTK